MKKVTANPEADFVITAETKSKKETTRPKANYGIKTNGKTTNQSKAKVILTPSGTLKRCLSMEDVKIEQEDKQTPSGTLKKCLSVEKQPKAKVKSCST